MKSICNTCGTVFRNDIVTNWARAKCPIAECEGKIHKIEDIMVPSVKTLASRGYTVLNAISGQPGKFKDTCIEILCEDETMKEVANIAQAFSLQEKASDGWRWLFTVRFHFILPDPLHESDSSTSDSSGFRYYSHFLRTRPAIPYTDRGIMYNWVKVEWLRQSKSEALTLINEDFDKEFRPDASTLKKNWTYAGMTSLLNDVKYSTSESYDCNELFISKDKHGAQCQFATFALPKYGIGFSKKKSCMYWVSILLTPCLSRDVEAYDGYRYDVDIDYDWWMMGNYTLYQFTKLLPGRHI